MSGVTVRQTKSISAMLELYSERLESLREEMRTAHEQVESLAEEFRSLIENVLAAEQSDIEDGQSVSFEPFSSRDPDIGSEIEILTEADDAKAPESAVFAPLDFEATAASVSGSNDDLTHIYGIDTAAAETLHGFGIDSYAALAAIDTDEAAVIGLVLGDADRVERESWVEQANALAIEPLGFGLDTTAVTLAAPTPELSTASTARQKASDDSEIAAPTIPVAIDPVFDDIVIEQDPTTRQLIQAAAVLAKTVAAEKQRERADALSPASATLIEFGPAAAAVTSSDTQTHEATAAPAAVIDLTAHRSARRHRRPRAIAASLVVLLITGIAVGAASDQILGFDLSTVASCGEAVLHGNTRCLEFPASL